METFSYVLHFQRLKLKKKPHRHHQILWLFPWDALPATFSCCLSVRLSSLLYCVEIRWQTQVSNNIPFCLGKLMCCFWSVLWVFIHFHCEVLYNQFWGNWLTEQSKALINFRIHPATSVSCHIINNITYTKDDMVCFAPWAVPFFLLPSFWYKFILLSLVRTLEMRV